MQDGLRQLGVALASLFAGLACAAGVGWAVFAFPALVWGEDIMLIAGWFTTIPAMIAGPVSGVFVGKRVAQWLQGRSADGSHGFLRNVLVALLLVMAAGTAYVLRFGLYEKEFAITWQEPVALADGTAVQARRTRHLERTGVVLRPYANVRYVNEELTFEAGPPHGTVTVTTGLVPVHLNRIEGTWYLVLGGRESADTQKWGKDHNTLGQRLAVLKDGAFVPAPWSRAPAAIVVHNLMGMGLDTGQLAGLQRSPPTLATKQALFRKYLAAPYGPDPLRISRPRGSDQLKDPYRAALQSL